MSIETLLLLFMFFIVIGILPAWPYSKPWGYKPMGVLTLLLVVFLVWAISEGRPLFRSSVGQDLKSAGRNVAESIRHVAQ